jgi:hypothetical protein
MSQKGLLDLLCSFVSKVYSSTGDYYKLEKKSLGEFIVIERLDGLVAAITDEDIQKMTDKEKQAVDLYRNPPKHDW